MIERSLFEYLLNTLWQLPLLLIAAWLLIRIARPAPVVQHALWLVTLLCAVLLPARGIEWKPAASTPIISSTSDTLSIPIDTTISPPLARPTLSSRLTTLTTLRIHPLHLRDRTIDWLLALYAVSIALSLARLIHGYVAARRMVASSIAHPLTALESALLNVCAQRLCLPASRIPAIRFLDDPSASPMVIGIRHPILLLPASLRHSSAHSFSDHDLTAILSHELAHIRRRDYLANLIARIVALPIAYHPATHSLHTRIRQTREMICDAHAASGFDSASTYAHSLLAIARRIVDPKPHIEAVGLFDHARNNLEERIMNLTAHRLPSTLTVRAARIGIGAALLIAATGAAATLHLKPAAPVVYAAQEPQATQSPAPSPAQAPVPAPDPQTSPAASPTPAPTPALKQSHKPSIIVDGQVRDLTPEEREQLERDLAESTDEVFKATQQLRDPAFRKQLDDSLKSLNSAEFKKQMADMQANMKSFNTPEFQKQIADAQKLAAQSALNDPKFKIQMDQLKLQFDSPEFRAQIEQAKAAAQQMKAQMEQANSFAQQAKAEADQRAAAARQQLEAARQAINQVKQQLNDPKLQEQLDQAQRSIQDANKKLQ